MLTRATFGCFVQDTPTRPHPIMQRQVLFADYFALRQGVKAQRREVRPP